MICSFQVQAQSDYLYGTSQLACLAFEASFQASTHQVSRAIVLLYGDRWSDDSTKIDNALARYRKVQPTHTPWRVIRVEIVDVSVHGIPCPSVRS